MLCKVLFCAYDEPGNIAGPSRWLVRMLPLLAKRGIEPYCLWMAGRGLDTDNPAEFPNVTALSKAGIFSKLISRPYYTEEQIKAYIEYCNEIQPDVFVPNLCVPAYYAGRWIREAGIPSIGILHSDDPFYHGILEHFVARQSPYQVTACVGVSRRLEGLIRSGSSGRVNTAYIPYGCSVPAQQASLPGEEFHIIYSGRLVQEQKCIVDVTRVMCRITRSDSRIKATICGEGDERESVANIIAAEAPEGGVTLLPLQTPGQLQKLLLKQHAIILLSEYEGTPNAIMEAMASGVVPICFNIQSGIPDIIEHGENGIIVNDRNDEVVEAVNTLKKDTAYWQNLSINARKTIKEKFSESNCNDLWAALIKRLAIPNQASLPIRQPGKVSLPRPHPNLKHQDLRPLPLYLRAFWKLYGPVKILCNKIADKFI